MLLVGVLLVGRTLSQIDSDLGHSKRFTLTPTEALPEAVEAITPVVSALQAQSGMLEAQVDSLRNRLRGLDDFLRKYHAEWKASDSPGDDARRFRANLAGQEQTSLLEDERRLLRVLDDRIASLDRALQQSEVPRNAALSDALEIKQALWELLRVNISFVAVDHSVQQDRAVTARTLMLAGGLGVIVLTAVLGVNVRNAIGPRISRLVRKIKDFQRTGRLQRSPDPGADEIAELSHALDAGFSAIEEREHDRERFLAVAAHELKTPVTSIAGFAHAARVSSDSALQQRALEVVERQANRLSRITQDILLAAEARKGQLPFRPSAIELRCIVRKVVQSVDEWSSRLELAGSEPVYMIGDQDLLEHAIAQAAAFACAVAEPSGVVRIAIGRCNANTTVEVTTQLTDIAFDEVQRAFSPFAVIQYEGASPRYAIGLYLSREIARLHGGTLLAKEKGSKELSIVLQLPA